jgi:hypothetical protein
MVKSNIIIGWVLLALVIIGVFPTSIYIGGGQGIYIGGGGIIVFIISILLITRVIGPKKDEPETSAPV